MTDDEMEEMVANILAKKDMLLYSDSTIAIFLFVASTGNIHIFTDELEVSDKFKRLAVTS